MGDKNADLVSQIFLKYQDLMFEIAFDIVKNKEDAEDVVQWTAEKMVVKSNRFIDMEDKKVECFIRIITRNTAIDFYRKREKNQEREECCADIMDMLPTNTTVPCETDANIAFDNLPRQHKTILLLKYSFGYKMREIADILDITEPNARKRIERAKACLMEILKKGFVVVLCILALVLTGVAVDALIDGRFFESIKGSFGAAEITDENRHLVGKEKEYEIYPSSSGVMGFEIPEFVFLSNSNIINDIKNKDFLPRYVSDIQTSDGRLPEIIIDVNACAVLYQEDYAGWKCEEGETLYFDFSEYPLENGRAQTLIVGYVLNGVMYEGEFFEELNGSYQLEIEKEGEYYIYLLSGDVDYISIEYGAVFTGKKED